MNRIIFRWLIDWLWFSLLFRALFLGYLCLGWCCYSLRNRLWRLNLDFSGVRSLCRADFLRLLFRLSLNLIFLYFRFFNRLVRRLTLCLNRNSRVDILIHCTWLLLNGFSNLYFFRNLLNLWSSLIISIALSFTRFDRAISFWLISFGYWLSWKFLTWNQYFILILLFYLFWNYWLLLSFLLFCIWLIGLRFFHCFIEFCLGFWWFLLFSLLWILNICGYGYLLNLTIGYRLILFQIIIWFLCIQYRFFSSFLLFQFILWHLWHFFLTT